MDLPQIEEYKPRLTKLEDAARAHFCVPNVEAQITDAHLICSGKRTRLGGCFKKR
ncbi:MAG: hypothetical protein MUO26_15885 [Methanotrichaceae archaeon]|nr:hypothetical protein [Methanotrichaceae archaeon]